MGRDFVIGKDAKLYYNTGTHATPVWVEIERCKDVNVGITKGKAEVTDRVSGWKMNAGGLKEADISFGYTFKPGTDTIFDMLLDSFMNDTPVEYAVMDANIATSGSQGLRAYMELFEFPFNQELEGAEVFDMGLSLTRFEEASVVIEPDWYEVP